MSGVVKDPAREPVTATLLNQYNFELYSEYLPFIPEVTIAYFSSRLIFAEDISYYRNSKLVKMQDSMDCGVTNPYWEIYNVFLYLRVSEYHQIGITQIVRDEKHNLFSRSFLNVYANEINININIKKRNRWSHGIINIAPYTSFLPECNLYCQEWIASRCIVGQRYPLKTLNSLVYCQGY